MRTTSRFAVILGTFFLSACGSGAGGDGGGGPDAGSGSDGGEILCGSTTCGAGEMCHEDQCVAECASVENLCGVDSELCCGGGEACLFDACVPLAGACEFTEDCEIDEICEPTLGQCVPRDSVPACEFVPPPGVFSPEVGCQWRPPAGDAFESYDDVVMTPSVANLTDDNGDGVTDRKDTPDIVFVSFDRQANGCCTGNGVIRVVSGDCNYDGSMNQIATLGGGMPWIGNSTGIALGNLHPASDTAEHAPEIVATLKGGGTIAFRRTAADGTAWETMWQNLSMPDGTHTLAGAQPSLADLTGDGRPEVVIGNVVLDGMSGNLLWDGKVTVGASAGTGNNAFLGPVSTIADLDLDGNPEVIAGNTAYDGATGAEKWTYTYVGDNSSCAGGAVACDGYNAVGDFDDDDQGEVVMVRRGEVFVVNHDGTELHRVPIPVTTCSSNESGPPTVADFDGDGRAEIGTASANFYVVVDFDCTGDPLPAECDSENILWKVPNQDCSSRATGSSVFDFDGDGNAEVVYADETSFRILAGKDGAELFNDTTHSSNTRMEMPIVVDVDNDGKSEIIVPEPNTSSTALGGIEVWQDADNNWVRTRRIWNQHSYHVSNIDEDGQVPPLEEHNWLDSRLNNFRQNVQPAGLFDAPDLTADVALGSCITGGQAIAQVTVSNQGALGVPAGIDVFVVVTDAMSNPVASGVIETTVPLLPGESEVLDFVIPVSTQDMLISVNADDDGMGGAQYNECDEDNNDLAMSVSCNTID